MSEGAGKEGFDVTAEFDRQWAQVKKDSPLVASVFAVMQMELYYRWIIGQSDDDEGWSVDMLKVYKLGPVARLAAEHSAQEMQEWLAEAQIRASACMQQFKAEMARAQDDYEGGKTAVGDFIDCIHS
jgi:hypothetical protein